MRALNRRRIVRIHKIFFSFLTLAGFAVALTTVMIFVTTFEVREIAPFFLPALAGFFGFSALLYNRARAYPEGPTQRRSLYVANQALIASILYLMALLLGAIVTFAIFSSNFQLVGRKFSFENPLILRALLFYWLPLLFVGLSYNAFSNALRLFCIEIVLPKRSRAELRQMRK